MVAITYDRDIERNCKYRLVVLLNKLVAVGILIVLNTDISAELDFTGVFRSLQFKRISVLQPVIRRFDLITVLDLLLEHTETVTDTAAVCRIAKCCQRIQETCGKSSKTAVAKSRISLLIFHSIDVQAHIFQSGLDFLVCLQVDQ